MSDFLKRLEGTARKDNADYPVGCAVVFDVVAMGLGEHGFYTEELARDEMPAGAVPLTREKVESAMIFYFEHCPKTMIEGVLVELFGKAGDDKP